MFAAMSGNVNVRIMLHNVALANRLHTHAKDIGERRAI